MPIEETPAMKQIKKAVRQYKERMTEEEMDAIFYFSPDEEQRLIIKNVNDYQKWVPKTLDKMQKIIEWWDLLGSEKDQFGYKPIFDYKVCIYDTMLKIEVFFSDPIVISVDDDMNNIERCILDQVYRDMKSLTDPNYGKFEEVEESPLVDQYGKEIFKNIPTYQVLLWTAEATLEYLKGALREQELLIQVLNKNNK